ncbi:MAG: nucleotidyltransferase, partial [Chitinivibrionales bacterium]|nr:nucleotidyltransferase [Chitinivibrionales bacterium]
MSIPNSQLETWSNLGAQQASKTTYHSIRDALMFSKSNIHNLFTNDSASIFLQGSYRNSTNIRGDSDVDLVVLLHKTFNSNLTEEEKRILNIEPATYTLKNFRLDVIQTLKN